MVPPAVSELLSEGYCENVSVYLIHVQNHFLRRRHVYLGRYQ